MDTEQKETDILKRKNKDLQFCLDKEVSNVMNLTSELQSTKQQRDELLAAASVYATKYLEDEYDSVEHCIDDEHHAAVVNLFKAIAKAVSNG